MQYCFRINLWLLFHISMNVAIDHVLRVSLWSPALHIKKFEKHRLSCQLSSGVAFFWPRTAAQLSLQVWQLFTIASRRNCYAIFSLYLHGTGQLSVMMSDNYVNNHHQFLLSPLVALQTDVFSGSKLLLNGHAFACAGLNFIQDERYCGR